MNDEIKNPSVIMCMIAEGFLAFGSFLSEQRCNDIG